MIDILIVEDNGADIWLIEELLKSIEVPSHVMRSATARTLLAI